jgi:hypothetical protein
MACAEQSEWADPTEKSELTWHGITVRNRVGVMIALGSTTIASNSSRSFCSVEMPRADP